MDPIVESNRPQESARVAVAPQEYDSVLGRTTRWSTDQEEASPFNYMSREELFLVDSVLEELQESETKKRMEEQRMMEKTYESMVREAEGCWDAGFDDERLGQVEMDQFDVVLREEASDDEQDLLNLLDSSLVL